MNFIFIYAILAMSSVAMAFNTTETLTLKLGKNGFTSDQTGISSTFNGEVEFLESEYFCEKGNATLDYERFGFPVCINSYPAKMDCPIYDSELKSRFYDRKVGYTCRQKLSKTLARNYLPNAYCTGNGYVLISDWKSYCIECRGLALIGYRQHWRGKCEKITKAKVKPAVT